MRLSLRFDLSAVSGAPGPELYSAALEMAQWADEVGFDTIYIGEHHGAEGGYIPSPGLLAAAITARTTRLKVHLSALLLPLHDPVSLAEDIVVLDLLSAGRLEVTLGIGYRPVEYAMFGVPFERRVEIFEEKLEVLLRALRGDSTLLAAPITPRPVQVPHPVLYLAGSSRASARRAAERGLGYRPSVRSLYDYYGTQLRASGHPSPDVLPQMGPGLLFVARKPGAALEAIGPHALFMNNVYARWAGADTSRATTWSRATSAHDLLAEGTLSIVTPQECLALAERLGDHGELQFQPLVGGLDPEVGWEGLRLLETEVLPHLDRGGSG